MLEPEHLEQGLELFRELVLEDEVLGGEYRRSVSQYFAGSGPPDPATPEGVSAAHRHLEWFLFERVTDPVRELAAEQLLERWRERAEGELADHPEAFLESHAGIFAVTGVDPGAGAWLHDLAGLGQYPVTEPEASRLLIEGDLIVGRLYPVGDALYSISRGAGFFREPNLVRALEEDMERLRATRSHALLRIAQRELEATFWGSSRFAPPTDPVGEARRTLLASGVPAEEVDHILAALAAHPLQPSDLIPGAGDRLGEILEQLAFHTEVDLEQARVRLLLAWQHLSAAAAARLAAGPGEDDAPGGEAEADRETEVADVRRAVAELDRRLQAGEDVDSSFDELERSLGLDRIADPDEGPGGPGRGGYQDADDADDAADDDDADDARRGAGTAALEPEPDEGHDGGDGSKVPDFPGVVGAMVEEYLWEQGLSGTPPDAQEAELLRLFSRFEQGLGVFEELSSTDVLRFATFWLPESGALETAERAGWALGALERFCSWAEENHAPPRLAGVRDALAELRGSLPRAAEANQSLEVAPRLGATPEHDQAQDHATRAGELFEFLADLGQGRARVRDRRDVEHELAVRAETASLLAVGDRVRASREDGRLVIHCCYPPQIARLAPDR